MSFRLESRRCPTRTQHLLAAPESTSSHLSLLLSIRGPFPEECDWPSLLGCLSQVTSGLQILCEHKAPSLCRGQSLSWLLDRKPMAQARHQAMWTLFPMKMVNHPICQLHVNHVSQKPGHPTWALVVRMPLSADLQKRGKTFTSLFEGMKRRVLG